MGVDLYGYTEVSTDGRWEFAGQMVPSPEREYDSDEPELMRGALFHSYHKELAAILTDTGNPIRSSEPYTPIVPRRGDKQGSRRQNSAYFKISFRSDEASDLGNDVRASAIRWKTLDQSPASV